MDSLGVEHALALAASGLRLVLEGISVATVLVGLVMTLLRARRRGVQPWRGSSESSHGLAPLNAMRVSFGGWLSLALEFQLGADIVATTSNPNRDTLIQLGVVAVIRTFLNVFLARELEAERRLGQGH